MVLVVLTGVAQERNPKSAAALLAGLFSQPDNTATVLVVTNGLVRFGSANMGVNDGSGSAQYIFAANSNPLFRGTTAVSTSKENLIEIDNYDRTQFGSLSFSAGITNPGSSTSMLSPPQNAQLGLGGDLLVSRLLSVSNNFNRVFAIAIDAPLDFALYSTATKGTNSGTWAPWYHDGTNGITYFGWNARGATPRDSSYLPLVQINHTTGTVLMTNGTVTISNLTTVGAAIFGNSAGASVAMPGTNITVGSGGTANISDGSFAKLKLNALGSTICTPAIKFADGNSFGFAPNLNTFAMGFCNGTITTNIWIDRVANTMYLQNAVTIGQSNTLPATAVSLDLTSTNQVMVLNRLTKAARNALSGPVAGMAVYQTDNTPGLRVYNGANWMRYTETAD